MGIETLREKYLSYQEAADYLAVSEATIRNWVKLGKLAAITINHSKKKQPVIREGELEEIKREIMAGNKPFLKSRRNKLYQEGFSIPKEYIPSGTYGPIISLLLQWGQAVSDKRWILIEIVLNFLAQQKKIQPDPEWRTEHVSPENLAENELSLTEKYMKGRIRFSGGKDLIDELLPSAGASACLPADYLILRQIRQLQIPWIEGEDFLGLVYASLSTLSQRKKQGVYYTPRDICIRLVHQCLVGDPWLERRPHLKVLDPCCGTGNFLIHAYLFLRDYYLGKGRSLTEVETFLTEKVLHGWDIDPTALALAKINLWLLQTSEKEPIFPLFRCCDSLKSFEEAGGVRTGSHDQQRDPVPYGPEDFDVVMGNPPWGAKAGTAGEPEHEETFVRFTYLGVQWLKSNGILGYVLPEAVLHVQKYATLRSWLIDHMQILEIADLGHRFTGVSSPVITFIAQKGHENALDAIRLMTGKEVLSVSQTELKKNPYLILNPHATRDERRILEYLRSLPHAQYLRGQCDFALGIVTGNNQKYVLTECPEHGEKILKGRDIFRFKYRETENYLVFNPERLQQVAPEKFYRAEEKLIYRFINKRLVFAYDNQRRLTLNSANILIPHLPEYDIFYVLAILNSRVAQFYHERSFYSVKILRQHLESIPLPACTRSERRKLRYWALKLTREENPGVRLELYEALDQLVMDIYGLDPHDQAMIRQKVGSVKYL